jgi:hypothetical protein
MADGLDADDFDFSPLSDAERDAAPKELARDGEPDVVNPTLPPADAEPAEVAAARLYGRQHDMAWPYATADGETAFYVCRWNRPDGEKDIRPLSWFAGEGWRFGAWPAPRPLYNLDKIAAHPNALVIVTEGEKAADAAACIFPECFATTSAGGARAAAKTDWMPLAGGRVLIWPDADEPGAKYAREVASILAELDCDVSIVDAAALAAHDPNGGQREPVKGWDAANSLGEWTDLCKLRDHALGLASLEVGATTPTDNSSVERRIAELSALSDIDYALVRNREAKELGLRVGDLDRLVKDRRPRQDDLQGRAVTFSGVEPWPEPVDGAAMLHELAAALRAYVVITPVQADALALWAVFSHVHDAFDVSPRLVVKSPHKRSGKTTLFTALFRLVAKPRGASGITSSALLRLIELHHPTMLIDEMDALMAADREMSQALRGLMNSGFNRRFANFTMNVPTREGGYEPREFSTWTPLALAGIGDLPDTVRDRSIEIEMKRKLATETVKRLRRRDGKDLDEIARKLFRWASDNLDRLGAVEPSMPDGLNDRAADAWEPLAAIAEVAGGD